MTLLKEFALECQTCNRDQKRAFSLQTRCVTALYERLLPVFKNDDCWKVLLACTDQVTKKQFQNLLGVYVLEVAADVDGFFTLSDTEKKEWAWRTLCAGIDELLNQTEWPRMPFSETGQKIQELNLINHWIWSKPVHSPSRKYIAEVLVEHEVQACDISVVIRDHERYEIKREVLASEAPDEWAYDRHLGTLSWETNKRVVLRDKSNKREWIVDI